MVNHTWAILIGGIGGLVCTVGMRLLERWRIDDVVGAIPAHLFAGIWGTMAVCIVSGGTFLVQLTGIAAIGAFVFASSYLTWLILERTLGCRVSPTVEELGAGYRRTGHRSLS